MKTLIFGGEEIIIGSGAIKNLDKYEGKKVFIVTGGKSMFNNGTIDGILEILSSNQCINYVYSGIKNDPTMEDVLKGLEKMQQFNPDILIAVGGGSPMDAAKVMSILYEYPEIDIESISTTNLPQKRKNLKLVFIPSTSGTGSEVTKAAVITFGEQNIKIGLKTDAFIPDVAILDPTVTLSMPKNVVAETGMDALTHALECYINEKLDPFTEVLAKGAIEGIFDNLVASYREGRIKERENMHYYQCMAGLAFANVGLGMSHGISHAVGALFDLSHGLINAISLPHVLRFNSRDNKVKDKLNKLSKILEEDIINAVINLNEELNIPKSLKECGILREEFEQKKSLLLENSMKGSTRVNPVKPTVEEMDEILENIYNGIY